MCVYMCVLVSGFKFQACQLLSLIIAVVWRVFGVPQFSPSMVAMAEIPESLPLFCGGMCVCVYNRKRYSMLL